MVRNISNQNTIEDFTEEIDEAELVRQYNSSHLLMKTLYLCMTLMDLLLGFVLHSFCLVTMAVPMPQWDVTSDYLSQTRDSPVWITIRDFLFPPDMLAMRTAGPKWNHTKLYGSFAALWFFLMEKGESEKGESECLCCNFRQGFDHYESDRWPLDHDWLREDYFFLKSLHSLDSNIPTFDLDTSCAAVMTCVSS